jgi:hypothetical protein
MGRLALNAQIRAAHLGEQGTALGRLAATMQELAADCVGRASEASTALDGMMASATELSHGEVAGQGVIEETHAVVDEVHASAESSYSRGVRIQAFSAKLGEQLERAQQGMAAGPSFDAACRRLTGRMGAVARELVDRSEGSSDELVAADLRQLASAYVMEAQRDVHAATLGHAVCPAEKAAARAPEPQSGQVEELGDNVELF